MCGAGEEEVGSRDIELLQPGTRLSLGSKPRLSPFNTIPILSWPREVNS